jgi:head-tail adaptor
MLTAADLAYMQDTQEQAMPGTVVIERVTLTSDGMGGNVEAWGAVGTVIGRIYPQSTQGVEAVGGAQVLSELKWWATLPAGTTLYAQDRLFYGNSTFEVIRVNTDEMWQTATRAELQSTNDERRI